MISRTMSRRSLWRSRMILGALTTCILGLLPHIVAADTHYVDIHCTNSVSNYTSWATASTNIQLAVDAAAASDTVLVSNGVYNTGGLTQGTNSVTNRVVISKGILLAAMSTNPADTVIEGAADPLTTNGPAAVRCVRVSAASVTISGFTLRFGHTQTNDNPDLNRSGGGIYGNWATVTNCTIVSNAADYNGGGGAYCYLRNCTVSYNTSGAAANLGGGGMYGGTANDSTIHHNIALNSGGGFAALTVASNCLIYANTAMGSGGGAYCFTALSFTLYDCVLSNNYCESLGSGAYRCWLIRCRLINNLQSNVTDNVGGGALGHGNASNCLFVGNTGNLVGGALGGTVANAPRLYNCLFIANSSRGTAYAGACGDFGYLQNCTVVSNSAATGPGGLGNNVAATNCIVVNNYRTGSGVSNYSSTVFAYSCTYPLPTGAGDAGYNTSADPRFRNPAAGDYHLTSPSPCVNAGTNADWINSTTTDLDGLIRIRYGRVDMGCYEHIYPGAIFSVR